MQDADDVVLKATHRLSQVFGHKVAVNHFDVLTEGSRRNRLIRIHLDSDPVCLVIKQRLAEDNHDDTLMQEWAATEFLSNLPDAPRAQYCPRFYLGDLEHKFFIMEDLGNHTRAVTWDDEERHMDASLVQPLLGKDSSEARHAVISLMENLARMHAATIGHYADYSRRCDGLGISADARIRHQGASVREFAKNLSDYLAPIGLRPEPVVFEELETLANQIESPGPFLALVHGDPCPDNCLYFDGHLRLVDFEFSGYGHALLDAAFPRIAFPTCWCCSSLPADVVAQAESTYRAELVKGCAAAADDKLFADGMAQACAFWTLMVLGRLPRLIEADSTWGISSVRSRLLTRLEMVAGMQAFVEELPAMESLFKSIRAELLDRWDADPLRLYPAFD